MKVHNLLVAIALSLCVSNLIAATIEDVKIVPGTLGKDCKLVDGEYPVSIQAGTLYPMITDTYSALLTPPEKKFYQSVSCSNEKSTIYFYQYAKQEDMIAARGFIEGLIWGEGSPSKMHPELIQDIQNILVVISGHHPEILQNFIRKPSK